MNNSLILNYHQIVENSSNQVSKYNVDVTKLRFQLEVLAQSSRKCLSPKQLTTFEKPGFVLSFDDGHASDIDIVLPLLKEFNFKATFFLPLNSVGFIKNKDLYKEALKEGHWIGAHGVKHSSFRKLFLQEQIEEMRQCKTELEDFFQTPITDFSLPYGQSNRYTDLASKISGFKRVYNTRFGLITPNKFHGLIPRVNIKSSFSDSLFQLLVGKSSSLYHVLKFKSEFKHFFYNSMNPEKINHVQQIFQK